MLPRAVVMTTCVLLALPAIASHVPNQKPHAESGGPYVFECSAPGEATSVLDGSDSHDHEPGPLMLQWTSSCLGTAMLTGPTPTWTLPVGAPGPCDYTCDLALQARDMSGLSDVDRTEVRVVDSLPPSVVAASPAPICLWPPNHRVECFEGVFASASVFDVCDPNPVVTSVSCSIEGDPTARSGDCVYDPATDRMCVRVERSGQAKAGRTYRLEVVARDACGNESAPIAGFSVIVPHDAEDVACPEWVRAPANGPTVVRSIAAP